MESTVTERADTTYVEQGPRKGIVIIVIAILLGTNGLLLWQFFEKKSSLEVANQQIVTTNAEKDALQTQLNQLRTEYEKVKSENSDLQTQLTTRDEEIKSKMAEIQRLISVGGPAEVARAKAELAKLKHMNNLYVAQIDSLNRQNKELLAANENLTTNLTDERSRNDNLSAENSRLAGKVAAGSVLKAMSIVTEGLKYNSKGKESVTNKAKQVQKMRTKFMLTENKVVDQGPLDVYLRILGPDGSVVSSDQSTFASNGQTLAYTYKQTIDYNNQETPVEITWAKGSQFAKGTYNVELYHNGVLIGKSTAMLK